LNALLSNPVNGLKRGLDVTETCGLVAVIVLNHNKKEDTLQCIRSVLTLDYSSFRVIVVDNGSTDGSYEAISKAFPALDVIRSDENCGAAGGRNFGYTYAAKHFKYQFVLFLDNDTVVEKNMLKRLVEALMVDHEAGIACPKAYQRFPSTKIMSVGLHVNLYAASIYDIGSGKLDEGQFDKRRYVPACGAFGFLIKQDVLDRLGGWDEKFNPYGWEDIDLCLRASKMGYKTVYVPHALIYHAGGRVGRGAIPTYEKYKIRNFFLLLQKHANWAQYVCCLLGIATKGVFQVGKMLLQGNLASVLTWMKGFFEAVVRR
jgi:GT2 family glycosyltransferase